MYMLVRTSSLSTFDSIEMGRYSDDLDKENDDKVAILEFELRKAYDTIKSLRGSLTEATGVFVLGGLHMDAWPASCMSGGHM